MLQVLHGLTVADVARRYRVGQGKVLSWIRRGELKAINTAANLYIRPRYVITGEALEAFERRRDAGPAPRVERKRTPAAESDYDRILKKLGEAE